MISTKKTALKSLLESKDGIHLTAYLDHSGGPGRMKDQIRETLLVAGEFLKGTLKPPEIDRFLEPIRKLGHDKKLLKEMNGNVGLFRTATSFRMLNIPVPVEQICVVATTFHVKPLLRWMQVDHDFLLLGLDRRSAFLYQGSQQSFRFVDSIAVSENDRLRLEQVTIWVNEWLMDLARDAKPRLFLAGDGPLAVELPGELSYERIHTRPLGGPFRQDSAAGLCHEVRQILIQEARHTLESALIEFYHAEDLKLGKRNIFQIAKAAIQGRVRKLIVADGIQIFGKMDPKTGGLAIHPADLDHEDDDLLDDLAQTVLAKGGEVIVAKRDEIPKGHPILAIIDRPAGESMQTLPFGQPPAPAQRRVL